jgi:hypothetical protein
MTKETFFGRLMENFPKAWAVINSIYLNPGALDFVEFLAQRYIYISVRPTMNISGKTEPQWYWEVMVLKFDDDKPMSREVTVSKISYIDVKEAYRVAITEAMENLERNLR